MADVFEASVSKTDYRHINNEAKNTPVTVLRPKYVTLQQQQRFQDRQLIFFIEWITLFCLHTVQGEVEYIH